MNFLLVMKKKYTVFGVTFSFKARQDAEVYNQGKFQPGETDITRDVAAQP